MIELLPIASTIVDWSMYLQLIKQVTGESVSSSIDQHKLKHNTAAFIVSLTELLTGGLVDPVKSIREAGSLLRHLSMTFLACSPIETVNQLREETDLTITSTNTAQEGFKVSIITGNMLQWRQAVINCSVERVSSSLRQFANKVMYHFELAGFSQLWSDYTKTEYQGTMKLIAR